MSDIGIGAQNVIANYNQLIGNNLPISSANNSIADFEEVLNKQNNLLTQNLDSTQTLQGGVNFDTNLFGDESMKVKEPSSADKMLNNMGKAFADGLNTVNNQQVKSQNMTMAFAAGEDVSVHDVMIESQKANLSLSMAVQMRNKLLAAYNEIYSMKF